MSNLSSEFREYEVDDLETLMGDGSEPQIHTGDEFDLHPQNESTVDSLDDLRRLCHIPPEVEMIVPEPLESPESGREDVAQHVPVSFVYLYCCGGGWLLAGTLRTLGAFPGSRIPNFWSSSELLRVHWSLNLGPQIRPVPSIDFLNFYKAVLERPVNWNSFTLERIHGAGFSVRMGLTNPVDPPPAGIDLSSLNARDRRKIKEANKKIKDQISLVGRDKKNATSTGDDKVYRKTLLVDDGSLEGSKSMAVAVNNASPSIPAAENVVAATIEEEGFATQDGNPDSGTVLKEPLGSGMLPPRRPRGNTSRVRSSPSSGLVARASSQADKEKIGNMFRCFHTRVGKKLPSFDWWKPDIKKMYISHSFHSSQKTAGLDSVRREEIERLERSGEETRKTLIETEQKLETALADHNFAKGEIELLRSELNKVKAAAEELERKNESLSELKDRDVRKISHDARKEVKGAGQKFLLAVQEFIAADKAWNKLNSERDEMKSNLDLIKEIEDGIVNLAEEKETFASEFADSPPLTEPNIGSSLDEMMLTGSPSAHFNEFGTNVDRISSGRAQGPSDQGLVTSSIMGDDVESRNETPQDVSSLNPEVVLATQDDDIGGALVSSQAREEGGKTLEFFLGLSVARFSMASPQGEPSDFNPPRFPSAETLFPPGDGFTPQGVAIPCFLSSMSKEEKIESPKGTFPSAPKGNVLEGNAVSLKRELLGLRGKSDVWSRMFITGRTHQVSEEALGHLPKEPRAQGNLSEKTSDSSKLISDDLPGASDIELTKTGRTGEPEGSRRLRKRTSIQVPIVLIERLSAQDRVKAEEFINKLITRHDELEDEKKEIRKKRRELGKRCLDIARELHCLEAHPSDWIELGLQEYGNMPSCIMSIVDLAGQGAELFRNSRPF
ncbi:hypothetical protein ISN44_As13g008710 [Arabidopsis suecica]|uniref:Uncharacterized protein n=1 Tax=Arabidopsis suecica TaxID=45249 RepID=A0A8T1Y0S3_ARASU|nr:hypothetical protein ISN44_As13g008710 [Arabidopsis suecica]